MAVTPWCISILSFSLYKYKDFGIVQLNDIMTDKVFGLRKLRRLARNEKEELRC